MAILFSIDNDRVTDGTQNLTLDETAGVQTPVTTDPGNDINVILTSNQLDGLDDGFEAFLGLLSLSDEQKAYSVLVDGASSSNSFIQVTANGGETMNDLKLIANSSTATNWVTLAGEPLYLHVDGTGNYATLTTSSGGSGRIVAAFALTNEVINNTTHVATAGVQYVTFEPISDPDATNPDDNLALGDVLKVAVDTAVSFNFAQLDAGNFLWAAVGSASSAMLITGQDLNVKDTGSAAQIGLIEKGGSDPSDAVNTSKATDTTIGINAQHFAPTNSGDGATAVLTFVTGFKPIGLATPVYTGQNVKQIDYDSYMNISSCGIFISQLTGSGSAKMLISLWEAGGGGTDKAPADLLPEEGYSTDDSNKFSYIGNQDSDSNLRDDTACNVASVSIRGFTWTYNEANIATGVTKGGITVKIYDGNKIEVSGAQANDMISFTALDNPMSSVDGTFNRIDIQALFGSAAFDIGHIDLTQGGQENVGLGSHLFVDDDGPSITAASNSNSVTHDETAGVQSDTDVAGTAFITGSSGPQIQSLFTGVSGSAIGFARSVNALVTVSGGSAGSDGPAAQELTYGLSVTTGTFSGVETTGGTKIFMYNGSGATAGLILGRVGNELAGGDTANPNGAVAFALAVNAATGEVFVAQYLSLLHPTGGTSSFDEAISLAAGAVQMTVTRTDGDGDTAIDSDNNIGLLIKFEDDGPSLQLVLNGAAELRLDETDNDSDDNNVGGILATNSLAAAAYLSTNNPNFGADGPAGTNPTVWSLTLNGANPAGVDSGLDDAVTNSNVMLFQTNSTTIVGRVGGSGGELVLTISINATTGELTATQNRAVEHDDPNDPDEPGNSSAMMNSGLISAVRTITDGDNDTTSASVDISQVIKIEDDGPSITAVSNSNSVTHDETAGVQSDTDVAGTAFITGGSGPQVQDLFAGIVGSAIGFGRSVNALVTVTGGSAGSDGPAAQELTYGLSATTGTFSGVETTLGTRIFMYNGSGPTAGLILGRVGNELAGGDTANPNGAIAFALAVNAATGEVFLAQYLSLLHPTGGASSFDEAISLATGAVRMTVTRTDGDGDSATDSDNNIGLLIKFEDDGPGISGSTNMSKPNDLEVANTSGASDDSFYVLTAGADGLKSFTIDGPADSSGTYRWTYSDTSLTSIKGTYRDALNVDHDLYTLVANSNGSYTFTMIGELPGSTLNLSTAEIKAGAPNTNSIEVGAIENDQFVRISGGSTVGAGNINESHAYVGVDNGNLDANETLIFTLHEASGSQINFTGMSIGTKSAAASMYHVKAFLVGGGTYEADLNVAKNGVLLIDPPGNVLVSSIEVTKLNGSATKIGLGDIDIFTLPADIQLSFTVRETDGDNDFVTASFTVDIDGNGDGVYSATVNSSLAPIGAASLAYKDPGYIDDSGMGSAAYYTSDALHQDYLMA